MYFLMNNYRLVIGARVIIGSALAAGILLFPKVKLRAQHPAPVPSPHAKQSRTREESKVTISQPGRIEYSYPLKGDEERRKSVKALQQLTVDLLALHNMYKGAHWDLTGPLYLQLHE